MRYEVYSTSGGTVPEQVNVSDQLAPNPDRLLQLIRRYAYASSIAIWMLKRHLGETTSYEDWLEGRVPACGELARWQGVGRYRFRGHGFVLQLGPRNRIETDFGPGGRVDGFCADYLRQYVRLNKLIRREFGDVDIVGGLHDLRRLGLVHAPEWEPTPHSLYLTEAGASYLKARYGPIRF
jgi:hypothetical protein